MYVTWTGLFERISNTDTLIKCLQFHVTIYSSINVTGFLLIVFGMPTASKRPTRSIKQRILGRVNQPHTAHFPTLWFLRNFYLLPFLRPVHERKLTTVRREPVPFIFPTKSNLVKGKVFQTDHSAVSDNRN